METIHITKASPGEHLLVGTDVVTIKASGQETSGKMLIVEVRVPPGGGPPIIHRHNPSELLCVDHPSALQTGRLTLNLQSLVEI